MKYTDKPLPLIKGWEKLAEKPVRDRGYFDGENCSVKYEVVVNIPDKIEYIVKILPYNKIEKISLNIDIECL